MCNLVERPLRRRQPDPHKPCFSESLQPFEEEGEEGPPLISAEGVDLIDDRAADHAQDLPGSLRSEQEVERLRGGDQDLRRGAQHSPPLCRRSITGTQADSHLGEFASKGAGGPADPGKGRSQVPFDIRCQRLERRKVEDLHTGGHLTLFFPMGDEIVDRR